MLLQVGIPAERLLLGPIGINDDLHVDALLAFLIRGNALHRVAALAPFERQQRARIERLRTRQQPLLPANFD